MLSAVAPAAATLASAICPASSTNSTSTAPATSERANSQGVPATTFAPSATRATTSWLSPTTSTIGEVEARSSWPFCTTDRRTPSSSAREQAASTRLVMALCVVAVMPTRRPDRTRSTIMWAPAYVLPDPGGPCTGRHVPPSRRASRRAAPRGDSPGRCNGWPSGSSPNRGARPMSRSRTARYGPGPSMPWSATQVPIRSRACRSTVVGIGVSGITDDGCGAHDLQPRRRSRTPSASSSACTVPQWASVRGSMTVSPTDTLCSWPVRNRYRCTSERPTSPTTPS